MDWTHVLVIVGLNSALMACTLVVVISLHINLSNAINENRRMTNEIIYEIKEEMKDFHRRLLEIEMARKNGT